MPAIDESDLLTVTHWLGVGGWADLLMVTQQLWGGQTCSHSLIGWGIRPAHGHPAAMGGSDLLTITHRLGDQTCLWSPSSCWWRMVIPAHSHSSAEEGDQTCSHEPEAVCVCVGGCGHPAAVRGAVRPAHPEDDMKLSPERGTPSLFLPISCRIQARGTCRMEEG